MKHSTRVLLLVLSLVAVSTGFILTTLDDPQTTFVLVVVSIFAIIGALWLALYGRIGHTSGESDLLDQDAASEDPSRLDGVDRRLAERTGHSVASVHRSRHGSPRRRGESKG